MFSCFNCIIILYKYLHGKIAHNEISSTQLQHNYFSCLVVLAVQSLTSCSPWPLIMSMCHRTNSVSGGQLYEHSLIVHPCTLTAL